MERAWRSEALEYLAGSELLAEEGVIIVEAARETEFDYLDESGLYCDQDQDLQDKQACVYRANGEERRYVKSGLSGQL